VFVGELAESLWLEKEGATGLNGEGGETGGGGGFEGDGADDGDVEAEILSGLGHLDGDGLSAAEEGAAFEGFIGSLEGFDSKDGAVAHDDGLADVEAAGFLGYAEAEGDVILYAAAGAWAGEMSGGGEKFLKVGGGREEFDSVLGEGIGHGSEEGLGITFLQASQDKKGGEIRAEVEEVFGRDLPGHDGSARAGFAGVGEKFSELADAEPPEVFNEADERRVGFVLEGGGADAWDAAESGGFSELKRITSVAGDDEERVGWAQHTGYLRRGWALSRR
jgi:hypothetical protein